MIANQDEIREARTPQRPVTSNTQTNRSAEEQQAARRAAERAGQKREKVQTFQRQGVKVGRNDDCPCGSGKKFKHCHGRGNR